MNDHFVSGSAVPSTVAAQGGAAIHPRETAKARRRALTILPLLGALAIPSVAHAAGLGNMTYTAAELQKPVAHFGGEGATRWPTGPAGANTVMMLHGKLVIMASNDSGRTPGSFHIYDVTNPRMPVLQKTIDGTPETNRLRELHAMPVAMIDGKTIMVLPSTTGLQFFDFTDPLNPTPAGTFTLTGANGGDYDNTVWMISWQWPYVFAGGTGNGIYVVDATDPAKCSLVTRIATSVNGGFRIGPTYAAGNYLIGMNMDQVAGTQTAVFDVGDPAAPSLLASGRTTANLYASIVVGDRIYGPGTNGDYVSMSWSSTAVSVLATAKSGGDRGGYCTYQSGFIICGQSSEGYKKFDVRGDKMTFIGNGTDPASAGGDFDFATVLGNLVFLGNDHGSGSSLIPHQMGPDMTAPEVVKVYPTEARQPLTSRVTIFFSEDLELDTVTPANIIVRPVGGAPLSGVLSKSSFNAISFGARAPLAANTTYEVVVNANGVTDLVGNPIAAATVARFSTGATIDNSGVSTPSGDAGGAPRTDGGTTTGRADGGRDAGPSTPPPEAGTGAGGSGGSTAGGTGGASGTGGSGTGTGGSAVTGGSGGDSATGGTGGTTSTGGSGGSSSTPTTGGSAGDKPAEPPAGDSGGCGCSVPGGTAPANVWMLALGAMAVGLTRLRGRNSRRGANRKA